MIAEMAKDSDLINVSNYLFLDVLNSYLMKQNRQETWRPVARNPTIFKTQIVWNHSELTLTHCDRLNYRENLF
jgi:hypothetical protein